MGLGRLVSLLLGIIVMQSLGWATQDRDGIEPATLRIDAGACNRGYLLLEKRFQRPGPMQLTQPEIPVELWRLIAQTSPMVLGRLSQTCKTFFFVLLPLLKEAHLAQEKTHLAALVTALDPYSRTEAQVQAEWEKGLIRMYPPEYPQMLQFILDNPQAQSVYYDQMGSLKLMRKAMKKYRPQGLDPWVRFDKALGKRSPDASWADTKGRILCVHSQNCDTLWARFQIQNNKVVASPQWRWTIPLLPEKIQDIQELDLTLADWHLVWCSSDFFDTSNIVSLNLSKNDLRCVPRAIARFKGLKTLSINDNQLEFLPGEMGQLQELEELSLSGNKLKVLPTALGTLPKLQRLSIGRNQFTSLPACVLMMPALKNLQAHGNQLTTLPEEIDNLKTLEILSLQDNPLTELPQTFATLPALQHLNFKNTALKTLPTNFENLKTLRSLDISGTQIQQAPNMGFWCFVTLKPGWLEWSVGKFLAWKSWYEAWRS